MTRMLYTGFNMKTKNLLTVSIAANIALMCGVVFLLKLFSYLPSSTPPAIFITNTPAATAAVTDSDKSQHPN